MNGAASHEQQAFNANHPGLYTMNNGVTCLKIAAGRIDLAALDCEGLPVNAQPDWQSMQPIADEED